MQPNREAVFNRGIVVPATARRRQGRLAEAESLAQEAVVTDENRRGDTGTDVAQSASALGHVLLDQRDFAGAAQLFRRALAGLRQAREVSHADVANAELQLAEALVGAGHYIAADSLIRSALRISERLAASQALLNDPWSVSPAASRDRELGPAAGRAHTPTSPGAAAAAASSADDGTQIVFTSDRDDPYRVGHPGNEEI